MMRTQFTLVADAPASINLGNLKDFVQQCEMLGAPSGTEVVAVIEPAGDGANLGRIVAIGLESE